MVDKNNNRSFLIKSHWRKRLAQLMANDNEEGEPGVVSVGKRLQALRLEMGLSQRALAEMSGLNFNTLSLIENEKTSPNVSTLQQLASTMGVPITIFFEAVTERDQVVFQKVDERQKTSFPHGSIEDLGGGMALGEATPLLLILDPLASSEIGSISHTGQEFIYCLEGQLSVSIGDEDYVLEPGDSLIFGAHMAHHYDNIGTIICRSILVISPSDLDDRAVTRHLAG
jgi:transcriptional regulator with XRE-family HTH domain